MELCGNAEQFKVNRLLVMSLSGTEVGSAGLSGHCRVVYQVDRAVRSDNPVVNVENNTSAA